MLINLTQVNLPFAQSRFFFYRNKKKTKHNENFIETIWNNSTLYKISSKELKSTIWLVVVLYIHLTAIEELYGVGKKNSKWFITQLHFYQRNSNHQQHKLSLHRKIENQIILGTSDMQTRCTHYFILSNSSTPKESLRSFSFTFTLAICVQRIQSTVHCTLGFSRKNGDATDWGKSPFFDEKKWNGGGGYYPLS